MLKSLFEQELSKYPYFDKMTTEEACKSIIGNLSSIVNIIEDKIQDIRVTEIKASFLLPYFVSLFGIKERGFFSEELSTVSLNERIVVAKSLFELNNLIMFDPLFIGVEIKDINEYKIIILNSLLIANSNPSISFRKILKDSLLIKEK